MRERERFLHKFCTRFLVALFPVAKLYGEQCENNFLHNGCYYDLRFVFSWSVYKQTVEWFP